ncbi:YcgL domain-containing protein [Vibrio ruber]|uniref:YcgL domain-containing protein VR7878_00631 n=1 Tax=Vibrio ruber (strain DSM 16370 / JCM 11486 / BCRC 17186 / CECT 7878 / LMG 23124 / VR1) TaxID=1123498 RepID=A0A1R4LC71_VIBR1|nr:YcgL domain-containing protein [Vibrio ruber]WNJ95539.1 YcgL domain-containing protein [Vibrio ruber]SJN54118.1 Protein YcgL [Vibrio ruber DSM 16370]
MLCSIYKSPKKEGTYLYIEKKDDFSKVPEALLQMFGRPVLVMTMSLAGKTLASVDIEKVQQSLIDDGFFLQLPPPPENLLESYKARKAARHAQ